MSVKMKRRRKSLLLLARQKDEVDGCMQEKLVRLKTCYLTLVNQESEPNPNPNLNPNPHRTRTANNRLLEWAVLEWTVMRPTLYIQTIFLDCRIGKKYLARLFLQSHVLVMTASETKNNRGYPKYQPHKRHLSLRKKDCTTFSTPITHHSTL